MLICSSHRLTRPHHSPVAMLPRFNAASVLSAALPQCGSQLMYNQPDACVRTTLSVCQKCWAAWASERQQLFMGASATT